MLVFSLSTSGKPIKRLDEAGLSCQVDRPPARFCLSVVSVCEECKVQSVWLLSAISRKRIVARMDPYYCSVSSPLGNRAQFHCRRTRATAMMNNTNFPTLAKLELSLSLTVCSLLIAPSFLYIYK